MRSLHKLWFFISLPPSSFHRIYITVLRERSCFSLSKDAILTGLLPMFNCTLSKKFDSSFYLLNNGDEEQNSGYFHTILRSFLRRHKKYPVKYEHPLVQYVTLHFRDWRGAASLRHENRAEITVLLCEQNPIRCGFRAGGKAVWYFSKHSLRLELS